MARRRRWIRWIAAAAGLLVFVIVMGLVVIQTAWFKDWLRAQAVRRASSVLNGELRIARLGGDLWTGVTLDGVEILQAGRPVITADRIRIRYDPWTLAQRRWNFDDIVVERADVHVVQTPEGWNLTQLIRRRESPGESATLSIGRLRLVSSQIALEPANARARMLTGVDADVALTIDRGRVALSIASLRAHDEATGLTLQELSGRADDTFRTFDVQVQLRAVSSATSIAGRVRGREAEEGREITGDLDLVHVDAGRLLDDHRWATDVTGRLSARASLPSAGPSAGSTDVEFTFSGTDIAALGYAATRLDAKGRVDATRVTFDARAQAYGAQATVLGDWRLPVGGHTGGFAGRGTFASVDLRRLPPLWRLPALNTTLAGQYQVEWRPAEWTARTTLGESAVEGARVASGTAGTIASSKGVVRYDATGDLARLDLQRLAQPLHLPELAEPRFASDIGGTFRVSGEESGEVGGRRLAGGATFAASRLSGTEISGMTATVDWVGRKITIEAHGPFAGLNNTTAAPLRVPIAINGQVDGVFVIHDVTQPLTVDNVEADGRVVLGVSTIRDVSIDAATIDARLAAGVADIRSLDVRGPSSAIQAKGRLALSGAGASDLHVVATSADLQAIGELLQQPLAGALALDAQITGSASSPSARGTVSLQQPAYGDIARALTATITFTGEWPGREPDRLALALDAAASFVEVKGQRIQQLSAKATGNLSHMTLELQALEQARTLDLLGVMAVDKDARELRLQRLAISTEGVSWALPADGSALVRIRPGQVDFEGLTLTRGDQRIDIAGRIESSMDVRVTLEHVAVADINRLLLGTRNLTGQINGAVTIRGDRQAPIVVAEIGIREGAVEGVLFQSADARLRIQDRQAVLDATLVQSPGVSLTATGTVPVGLSGESAAGMDVRIKGGPMPLGLAQAFTDEITKVTGAATMDVRVTGTPQAPDVRGTMSVAGGGFVVKATGAEYRDVEARLEFEGPTLAVRHLQVVDPDGDRLTASGALGVMGPQGDRQLDVQVRATKVSVLRNHFGTADIDADLRVQGTLGAPRIEGTLALDSGRIEVAELLERTTRTAYSTTPQAALTTGAPAELPAPSLFDRSSLAVRLTMPDNLALRGRQLRVANGNFGIGDMNILVGGEFDLVKPAGGRFDLQGTADVVRGTYTFQGRRFDVVPGSDVRFRGGPIGDPALNLTATREVAGITAQVRLQGTARTPRVTLSSQPPLEEGDVLSLIVFNQPMSALSASEQSNLADRAASIAAGAITTPLADSIARVLNLDVVEIQAPTSDTGTGSVAFGSRIGSRVFVGLRQYFGREDASVLSLEYRVTEVLRFVSSVAQGALQAHATRRTDQSGVDLIFVIRY